MEKGKAETPGTLNRNFINGFNNLPKKSTKPIFLKISETIKNGSKEGIIILNQVNKPLYPLSNDNLGFLIIPIKANRVMIRKKKLVNLLFID